MPDVHWACTHKFFKMANAQFTYGSIALLSHFHKVLALSKFAILKCEIEVNPIARIPRATSTAQLQFVRSW